MSNYYNPQQTGTTGYSNYPSSSSYNDNQWFSGEPESPTAASSGNVPYNYANYPTNPPTNYSGGASYGYEGNNMNQGSTYNPDDEDYENEPPLLEELGIRFDHIWSKTQAVIHPMKVLQDNILDDADLAGPIVFCLLMGSLLLLSGKVHFGYIYGFSVFGCIGMYMILNLVSERGMEFWLTCSVLGYCLLPVIGLSGFTVLLKLQNLFGMILAVIAIGWSTHAATRLFLAKMMLDWKAYYFMIAYPTMLLYSSFVLITIF